MKRLNRRTTLQGALATIVAGCSHQTTTTSKQVSDIPSVDWGMASKIVSETKRPNFNKQDFNIQQFGAVGDGKFDCSPAFRAAIAACQKAGGGRVVVSGGSFLTGPIHLKSNVNLHIEQSATIKFFTDPKKFLPAVFTRWEGVEYMGYSPLIYAYGEKNIALTGKGTLDGQANRTTWWPWKGNKEWGLESYPSQKAARDRLFRDAENGVPPQQRFYAEGAYLRPPFVQPYKCENVLIEDVRIIGAPFWLLNPVLCTNVTIRGVHLESLGPNSDGCDPESCKNVVIENCYFDTGDDCIAIKSGRNADGRRVNVAAENIVIRGCKMRAGHGGVVIGSEISGGVRNVFAENNEMSSPDLERGLRIKTNSVRGGLLENIFMRNCTIGEVRDAIVINFYYEEGDAGAFDPTVRNVVVENLQCTKAQQVFKIRGFKRKPIQQFTILSSNFKTAANPGIIEYVDQLKVENVSINGKAFVV
ncbi:MAG: glycoside hydrolase family 28 protein [Cellvibrionaceae bacterium]|nr:glycoside hydrolase family 28 protein [Cellvibrionaceae bacterium]